MLVDKSGLLAVPNLSLGKEFASTMPAQIMKNHPETYKTSQFWSFLGYRVRKDLLRILSSKKYRVKIFLVNHITTPHISHPNNEVEMTQIACRVVEKYGGRINYFRLMKLLYIIEHESWSRLKQPAMGGEYFSMHAGPMISEPANASKPELSHQFKVWSSHLATSEYMKGDKKVANQIEILKPAGRDEISDALLDIVDEVISKTRNWKNDQIEKYVHNQEVFPEYKEQRRGGRFPIEAEEILAGSGESNEKIRKIQLDSQEWMLFKAALA